VSNIVEIFRLKMVHHLSYVLNIFDHFLIEHNIKYFSQYFLLLMLDQLNIYNLVHIHRLQLYNIKVLEVDYIQMVLILLYKLKAFVYQDRL